MKRKLAGVLAAMLILVLGSTSVYAAASPTARDLLIQLLQDQGGLAVLAESEEQGEQNETEGQQGQNPQDLAKNFELATFSTIDGGPFGTNMDEVSEEVLAEATAQAASLGRDSKILAMADITPKVATSAANSSSGVLLSLKISKVDSSDNVYVLHKLESGAWETLKPSFADGCVVVVMFSFSPVALVRYPDDVIITPTAGTVVPTNPSGGDGSNGSTPGGNTSGDSLSNSQTGTQDQNGSQTGTQDQNNDQNSAQNNPQTNTQDQNSAQNNPQTNTQDQNSAQNNPQNQANSQSQNNPQNQTNNQTQSNNNNQNSNQTNDNNQSNSQVNNQNNPVNVTQNVTVEYPSKDQYEDGYAKGFWAGYVLANKTSITSTKKPAPSKTSTTKKVVKSPKTGAALPALPFALMSAAGLGVCVKKSSKE